ncbi:hypothetical protein [Paenibacillus eucommiae]|uniref:Rhodanese domain-containing protein n=1 Tax=Paenibacillus eucommiae TaxID=1355755 RepID=A0ABS4J8P0_9BACL|nr:hypothetical protein [Paenibacillus eucommiae]MBP1996208.1 hypothetical protein [Paenibacillus eucommiae]
MMLPHFDLFCMVTSGVDQGSYGFEKQSLWEHIQVYQSIFKTLFESDIEVIFSERGGYKEYYIGDGGFVDWTQKMLENKKERLLISAIGLDRLLL